MSLIQPEDALRAFGAKQFVNWHGLPAETRLVDVGAVCDVDTSWRATARLGETHRTVEWLNAICLGYGSGLTTGGPCCSH